MRIGIAYSLAPPAADRPPDGPDDRYEEFDKPETVEAIAAAMRAAGHEVSLLGDGREFLTRVLADPPDFVFNIAEGEGVGRSREARVPAVCEMLGIPYSGSDPLTLAAALDKDVAKRLVVVDPFEPESDGGMQIPKSWLLIPEESSGIGQLEWIYSPTGPFRRRDATSIPMIFKPAFEGSSKGIRGQCIAATLGQAIALYRRLVKDYAQAVLIEEFIDGDEVTVGLIQDVLPTQGNEFSFLGIMEIVPKQRSGPFVYSLEVKRDWTNQVTYEFPSRRAGFDDARLRDAAEHVFEALGCRDFARIDFRVRNGVPYFIEANPLPGLAPGTSDLVIMAEGYGISHGDLIRKILDAALTRVGLA